MYAKEVLKILKQNGWTLERIKGSHHIMQKNGYRSVAIPIHSSKELGKGLLKCIERETGVKLSK